MPMSLRLALERVFLITSVHISSSCVANRAPLSISGHYPGILVLYLLPVKYRQYCSITASAVSPQILKQVTV